MWPIPPTLQISRIDHVGRVYAPDIGVADIELHLRTRPSTTCRRKAARPRAFVDAVVAIDTPDPPRTNRYMLQPPGNIRPAARSISRALVDTVERVYTPDLGVAHIDLHEATRHQGPIAGAGPLAFVDAVVAIDTPDPPRTNRYMLQLPGDLPPERSIWPSHDEPHQRPGNARPPARSICRALPDPVVRVYTPDVGVANIELHEVRCKLVSAVRAIAFTSHIGLHPRLHICSSRGQCNEQQDKCSEVSTALMAT